MEFLIVSGLSGGGKSRAADVLEDLDFYCVDNLPTALLTKFAELCLATRGRYEKVALVTDIRSQESFSELFAALGELANMGVDYRILFVEASESAIVRRYKESRRPHPLQAESGCSLPEAVRRESELLAPVRERADYVINTTGLTLAMLQKRICEYFADGGTRRDILINVVAFGFKYGIPIDAAPIPDLIPVLSVVAALADGETQIVNAARLRLKESDRLESTAAMLRALGGQVEVHDSGLTITGRKMLTGGTVDPQHDHRIAMAAATAACGCTAPVTVHDCACTDKSYPRFWTDLSALKTVPAAENTELE